ncbi:MAG: hypothetical protein IJ520_09485, partial [Synergistaceae bacterium]|nr:hypothetical protein [Synergistaceae bacterium]
LFSAAQRHQREITSCHRLNCITCITSACCTAPRGICICELEESIPPAWKFVKRFLTNFFQEFFCGAETLIIARVANFWNWSFGAEFCEIFFAAKNFAKFFAEKNFVCGQGGQAFSCGQSSREENFCRSCS